MLHSNHSLTNSRERPEMRKLYRIPLKHRIFRLNYLVSTITTRKCSDNMHMHANNNKYKDTGTPTYIYYNI